MWATSGPQQARPKGRADPGSCVPARGLSQRRVSFSGVVLGPPATKACRFRPSVLSKLCPHQNVLVNPNPEAAQHVTAFGDRASKDAEWTARP